MILVFFESFEKLFEGEIAEKAMAATSYDQALAMLTSLPVLSSNYFILAGAENQGKATF